MTRPELLEKRIIGSSDAPIIMGVSPWDTPYSLWHKRVNNIPNVENAAMRRGNELEETARRWFEKKMGVELYERPIKHPSIAHMTATLDGIDLEESIIVELKCPGAKSHAIAKSGKIPEVYFPQLQHQLEIANKLHGLDHMFYCSFYETEGVIIEVGINSAYIEDLVEKETEFYECLLERRAPAMTERDIPEIQDNEWLKLIEEVKCIDAMLDENKKLQNRRDEIEEILKRIAGYNSAKGHGYKLTKIKNKGLIDYASIPELKTIDLETYRKKSFEKWSLKAISS